MHVDVRSRGLKNNKLIPFLLLFILQRRKKRGRETRRVLHNSIYIDTLQQKDRRKEGDGESATENNFYEELIAAPNKKDVENGNAADQELCTTQKENICTDETTTVCEANGEGNQEVVVMESRLYENPGEGTSSGAHSNDHY